MARTKQEVREFLNALQGLMVNEKCGIYNGQCVSLIKALLEFLGAPAPYSGRGNAKDVGNTLLSQGIAQNAPGWLNVCINRNMGTIYEPSLGYSVNYGHIWLDVANEFNIEQNGNRALRVTKNTRPYSQALQVVNLDQYIIAEGADMKIGKEIGYDVLNRLHHQIVGNWDMSKAYWDSIQGRNFSDLMLEWSNHPDSNTALKEQEFGEYAYNDRWDLQIYSLQDQLKAMGSRPTAEELKAARDLADELANKLTAAEKARTEAQAEAERLANEKADAEKTGNAFTRWLGEQLNKILGKG